MKKVLFFSFCAVLLSISAPQKAQAFGDSVTTNTKALGYDIDLNGFTYRFGTIGRLRFDISVGFGLDVQTEGGGTTVFDITPGFRLLFPIKKYKSWIIQAVAGVHSNMQFGDKSRVGFAFFGGLMPEIFILSNLSIEVMIGLSLAFNDLTNDAQVTIGTIGKGISVISGAAFHWYF